MSKEWHPDPISRRIADARPAGAAPRVLQLIRKVGAAWMVFTVLGLLVGAYLICAQEEPSPWEKDINAFTTSDEASPPTPGGLLFVGSSSIRFWSTLEKDFSGYPVIQRGFGGSEMSDTLQYAPQIVLPYRPRMVIVYAGDNDLINGKTPKVVHEDFLAFVELLHKELPRCRIGFIAIKPSPARWQLATEIRTANLLVKSTCDRDPLLDFLDIFEPMLDSNGEPRRELFRADLLHLNATGYALWTRIIKQHLPPPEAFSSATKDTTSHEPDPDQAP